MSAMTDPYTLWLVDVKAAADRLAEALHNYEAARFARSGEAERLWLDLLATRDRYEAAVIGPANTASAGQEK